MLRRGRPIMRTAAIVGTASVVSGSVQHHQQQKYAAQDAAAQPQQSAAPEPQYAPPPPAAPAAGGDDMVAQLENLKKLLDEGVLTQAEFDMQKQKLLSAS